MPGAARSKLVIVNADDFGWSDGVTDGILRAHQGGILTSTTIMANMPAAARAARAAAQCPTLGVGVHLNVCQGPPLSPEGRRLAGPDGLMRQTATRLVLSCVRDLSLLGAVRCEFDAQVRWALDQHLRPTHLDSHRHCHAFPPIFLIVCELARRYRLPAVRRHREVLPRRLWQAAPAKQRRSSRLLSVLGAFNRTLCSRLLPTCGTWGVACTGFVTAAWLLRVASAVRPGVIEIMTHPGLSENLDPSTSRLIESRTRELQALCDPAVGREFSRQNIKLIHYGQIPHAAE